MLRARIRSLPITTFVLLALGIVGYNGWLMVHGIDVPRHTAELARSMTAETWRALGLALGKLFTALRWTARMVACARPSAGIRHVFVPCGGNSGARA